MKEMKEWKVVTDSPLQTQRLAEMIGRILSAGSLITLSGDLGAGKTTFTQGLARGLGIEKRVTSPTFTIMKEYKGRLPLKSLEKRYWRLMLSRPKKRRVIQKTMMHT